MARGAPGHFALEPTSAISLRVHVDACRTPNLAETSAGDVVEFLFRSVLFVLFSLLTSVPLAMVKRHD